MANSIPALPVPQVGRQCGGFVQAFTDGSAPVRLAEMARRWLPFGEGQDGDPQDKDTSDSPHEASSPRPTRGVAIQLQQPTSTFEPRVARGTEVVIERYLFSDECQKGVVKVYIEAKDLEEGGGDGSFQSADVRFSDRSIDVRIASASKPGRVFVLRSRLFGPVSPGECRFALSTRGHKVSITLKKDNCSAWHRLVDSGGASASAPDLKDFL